MPIAWNVRPMERCSPSGSTAALLTPRPHSESCCGAERADRCPAGGCPANAAGDSPATSSAANSVPRDRPAARRSRAVGVPMGRFEIRAPTSFPSIATTTFSSGLREPSRGGGWVLSRNGIPDEVLNRSGPKLEALGGKGGRLRGRDVAQGRHGGHVLGLGQRPEGGAHVLP